MQVDFEGATYALDVDELDVVEATYIKAKTGFNLMQWQAGLEQADPDAFKALYWLMQKQNGKAVDIERVNFKIAKFAAAIQAAQANEGDAENLETPTNPRPTKDS